MPTLSSLVSWILVRKVSPICNPTTILSSQNTYYGDSAKRKSLVSNKGWRQEKRPQYVSIIRILKVSHVYVTFCHFKEHYTVGCLMTSYRTVCGSILFWILRLASVIIHDLCFPYHLKRNKNPVNYCVAVSNFICYKWGLWSGCVPVHTGTEKTLLPAEILLSQTHTFCWRRLSSNTE